MLKDLVTSENIRTENCCGGCGSPIRDRFYLLAVDRAWHGQCLRCCKCTQPLDAELSCFARDGNIYCKDDYFRLFSSRRCARCGTGLSSSELVMRARELVFHVDCFSCALCGIQLSPGDTAAIRSGRILCGDHYDADILSEPNSISSVNAHFFTTTPSGGGGGGGGQKGRPRKRKPSSSILSLSSSAVPHSDESSDIMERGSTPMRMELLHNEMASSSLDLTTYDGSQSPGSGGSISGGGGQTNGRAKRMRTSFKHNQLRTMKSYFAINQNPDAKDLKQLAQKTGLSKRVLQVWFQNARAKWRRNAMRQEGNQGHMNTLASLQPIGSSVGTNGPPSVQSNASGPIESGMTPSHALEEMHHMTFAELY